MFPPSIALSGGLSILVVFAGPAGLAASDPSTSEKRAEPSAQRRVVEKLGRGEDRR